MTRLLENVHPLMCLTRPPWWKLFNTEKLLKKITFKKQTKNRGLMVINSVLQSNHASLDNCSFVWWVAPCTVTCLSLSLSRLCSWGHCCANILAGHSLSRLMIPLAHLVQLFTKGGFCARSWDPCLVLKPPVGILEREATEGAIRELVWSNATYQIKLCFLSARSLHNWHEQMHKSYSSMHTLILSKFPKIEFC